MTGPYGSHDMAPFPAREAFVEVRMAYCRRCGATRVVESSAPHDPLPACPSTDTDLAGILERVEVEWHNGNMDGDARDRIVG